MACSLSRREFVLSSVMTLALPSAFCQESPMNIRFGMVTDPHYADRAPLGTRHYRESLQKMRECVELMNTNQVDFLIELGDIKDENSPANEAETLEYLETIENELKAFNGARYHVLGNHDMDSISKEQFLSRIENTGIQPTKTYYSFQKGGIQFIVLDACFKSDDSPYDHGNYVWTDTHISAEQIEWLQRELEQTKSPVIVFVHQLLSGSGDVYIKNAEQIRTILEKSGKVLAVFHGHHHAGDYKKINGIHYYTLKGMVEGSGLENSSYAIVTVRNQEMKIKGYRKAESQQLVF